MIRVWRVDQTSRAYIYGVTEGPASSFTAFAVGNLINIIRNSIGIMEVANADFSTICDVNGNSFPDVQSALVYLRATFTDVLPPAANAVEKLFTAAENLSALQCVYPSDNMGSVSIADPSAYETARVLGVVLTSAIQGSQVVVRLFGKLDDPTYQFPVKDDLFLGSNGTITNVAQNESADTGTSTRVGTSLGNGSIFITVDKPVEF